MATPKLSVTVLNYNYARFLPECMDSILRQDYPNFEVIILDDRSKDDSVEVAKRYLSDPRVRLVVHEQNSGFTKSLIEGTEVLSTGEYVTVISADDYALRNDAFSIQLDLLEKHPSATYCFSAFDFIRPNGRSTHHSFPVETVLGSREALYEIIVCRGVWPPHSGTIIRTSSYRNVGGYRRDITMPLDLALWFDLAMEGGFVYAPQSLYAWRLHGNQMTTSKTRLNVREIAQVIREACAKGEQRGFDTQKLTHAAIGAHLGAFAVSEAFAGVPEVALTRWFASVMECPTESLTSRRLWSAAARAALGQNWFQSARSAVRWMKL